MIRDRLGHLADLAYERVLELNLVSSFGKAGFVMRSQHFEAHELDVDMTGRVCVVSGANAGLGYATCQALAARGAAVHMLCRNRQRGQAARDALRRSTGNDAIEMHVVDVSEMGAIRTFADDFAADRVDVLVNNAGVLLDERRENSTGIELTWATNVAGAYLLTKKLVPRLEAAHGRVVMVSSAGMYLKKLDLDAASDDPSRRGKRSFDGLDVYANTKRALVVLAETWAPRLALRHITLNAMHPGWVDTAGVRGSLPRFYRLTRPILRSWDEGADTIAWLAVSEAGRSRSGGFFFDREARRSHLLPWTREATGDRARLLELLDRQTAA